MIEIAQRRLMNQLIAGSPCRKPEEVVKRLGAMQAQDYAGVLWSVGLRSAGVAEAAVEQAIAARKIARTWLMRGTLQLVAGSDIHWMLDLLAPRLIAGKAGLERQLELDAATIVRCEKLFVRELSGGRQVARDALMKLLDLNGISTAKQRGYHILWRLAQEKAICFGPRVGKQHTFVLLDEWIPAGRKLERDAALVELARRYFMSHGLATLQDFAYWAGLTLGDARAALNNVTSELSCENFGGKDYWLAPNAAKKIQASPEAVFLLPGFDEYLLGYTDRSAVLDSRHVQKVVPASNGRFLPTIVVNGRVAGTWKSSIEKRKLVIDFDAFKPMTKMGKQAAQEAADGYGRFLGLPV